MRFILAILILLLCSSFASAQHWSYPGSISDHLQSDHGQSVAGLTTEQMLDLHDSLHYAEKYNRPTRAPALYFAERVRQVKPLRSILIRPSFRLRR
jgi:hypothetical protein